jgi:hypothetical protein
MGMNKLSVSFLIVLLLAGCSGSNKPTPSPSAEPTPTASMQQPAAYLEAEKLKANFGFADESGKSILVTGQEKGLDAQMQQLNEAIGDHGQVLKVKLNKWQEGTENSNGREMAHNFVNLPGYLYTVEEGNATPDETYYLTDQAEFNANALISVKPTEVKQASLNVAESVRQNIVSAKNREVEHIWKLADLSGDRQLYLVQFIRQDQDMLFSLVLEDKAGLTFMDYPAVIQRDEFSVWRVDDGGEVIPEMFSILFAAETAEGPLLAMEWWGAEGVNTFFLKKEGNVFKEMDIQYGRYTSPL